MLSRKQLLKMRDDSAVANTAQFPRGMGHISMYTEGFNACMDILFPRTLGLSEGMTGNKKSLGHLTMHQLGTGGLDEVAGNAYEHTKQALKDHGVTDD